MLLDPDLVGLHSSVQGRPRGPWMLNERDIPLGFQLSVDKEAAERTGWKHTGDQLFDRAMRSFMACALIAAGEDKALSVSRTKDFYKGAQRYNGLPYTYHRIVEIIDVLTGLGLIREDRATTKDRGIRQTRVWATQKLIDAFEGVKFNHEVHEVLVLHDGGKPIDYREPRERRQQRKWIETWNHDNRDVTIKLPEDGITRTPMHVMIERVTEKGEIKKQSLRLTPTPTLIRIFCRGSWSCGGRLYWWGQNLPKKLRLAMLINGENVVELDYKAIHPSLLYATVHAICPEDPYLPPGVPREHRRWCKLALNVCFNARTKREAIGALVSFADDDEAWPWDWKETARVIRRLMQHNAAIADFICSDAGVGLQRQDSEITIKVLDACRKAGIVCLPVHDSFIVQARHEDALRSIMSDVMDGAKEKLRTAAKASENVAFLGSKTPEIFVSQVPVISTEKCSHDLQMDTGAPGVPGSCPSAGSPGSIAQPLSLYLAPLFLMDGGRIVRGRSTLSWKALGASWASLVALLWRKTRA